MSQAVANALLERPRGTVRLAPRADGIDIPAECRRQHGDPGVVLRLGIGGSLAPVAAWQTLLVQYDNKNLGLGRPRRQQFRHDAAEAGIFDRCCGKVALQRAIQRTDEHRGRRKAGKTNTQWLAPFDPLSDDRVVLTAEYYDALYQEVIQITDRKVSVIPSGRVFQELYDRGYPVLDLYSDDLHINIAGELVESLTVAAVQFHLDPFSVDFADLPLEK